MGVQFKEPKRRQKQQPQKAGLTEWLIARGIAKNEKSARTIQLSFLVVALLLLLMNIFFFFKPESIDEKYYYDPSQDIGEG